MEKVNKDTQEKKYQMKKGFLCREIAGSYVLVATGKAVKNYNKMISMNETSAFLINKLEKPCTKGDLVEALLSEYEVDRETAENNVGEFVETLVKNELVD